MDSDIQSLPMQTNVALQSARMQMLTNAQNASKGSDTSNLSADQKNGYAKVARGFESMFVHEMYKTMRQSMLDDDEKSGEEDMSFGGDVLQGMTDLQFADSVAQSGRGMGIATMIYKNLTGEDSLPSIITQHTGVTPYGQTAKTSESQPTNAVQPASSKPKQELNEIQSVGKTPFLERVSARLDKYDTIINSAADKFGVNPALVKAIITAESAGNPNAVSPVGAKGLMQLMDGTARDLDVDDPFNPIQNISGGTEYIASMMKKFGTLDHAIAAYNAGPGNVAKHNGIPPFAETQAYVRKVKRFLAQYSSDEG
ncbi:MAG: transglycosylase SLT domain-containing protein [Candidatus Kapabacteria bacterium]|nr:transglycosylase SLT domain-containing protein [Candidatus Kapabacteria bacterium]